jgi:hypothetical protein
MVHGAAGSSALGAEHNLWAPAAVGRDFDLTPTSLNGLAQFRDHLTIVSNTDVACAEPYTAREIGGDHFRSSAVFLTQAHPKLTDGADVEAGTSLDQIYASRAGRASPIPSMQLCIEDVNQGGACGFPYACSYTDSISWASPTKPLPMIRNPRVVFDEMFSVAGGGGTREQQQARQQDDRSILDWLGTAIARLDRDLGAADRRRMADYLDNVREIERRLQTVAAFNAGGEAREFPAAPAGVPDSFTAKPMLGTLPSMGWSISMRMLRALACSLPNASGYVRMGPAGIPLPSRRTPCRRGNRTCWWCSAMALRSRPSTISPQAGQR